MSRLTPDQTLVNRRHHEPPEAWLAGIAVSLLLHSLLLLGVRWLVARVVVADGDGGSPLEFIEVVPDPNAAPPAVDLPKTEGVPPPPAAAPSPGDPVLVAKANVPATPSSQPSPTQPAPQPSPTQPVPQPSPTQPVPQPSPIQPTPRPSSTQPTPRPSSTQSGPQPSPTQPVPRPSSTQPVPPPNPTQPTPQPQPTRLDPAKTADGKDPTEIDKGGGGGGGNGGPVRSAGAAIASSQQSSISPQDLATPATLRLINDQLTYLLPPTSSLPRGAAYRVEVLCSLSNPAKTATFQAKPQVARVLPVPALSAAENAQLDPLVRDLLSNATVEVTLDSIKPDRAEPELSEWKIQLQITLN